MNDLFALMDTTLKATERSLFDRLKNGHCLHTCSNGSHVVVSHQMGNHDECDLIEDDLWHRRLICMECDNADAWQGGGTVEGLIGRR